MFSLGYSRFVRRHLRSCAESALGRETDGLQTKPGQSTNRSWHSTPEPNRSRSSPAFVRSRSVDLRKRHVDEPEIHGELATMVDEVIQVLADHFPTWCRQ